MPAAVRVRAAVERVEQRLHALPQLGECFPVGRDRVPGRGVRRDRREIDEMPEKVAQALLTLGVSPDELAEFYEGRAEVTTT